MLNVQEALTAAHVPGYRGAFRPLTGQRDPPPVYCAYTLTRGPIWDQEDGPSAERVKAFLHLFSFGDPESAEAAIEAAMRAEGWGLVRVTESDDHSAGLYEVLSEWSGVRSL